MLFGQNLKGGTPFWVLFKDAGIVYESFQNELSNLGIFFSETNPRYESLRLGFANPKLKDSDSRISNFKDSFCAIVLRICWIRENRLNLLKIDWIRDHDTNRIFLNQDS